MTHLLTIGAEYRGNLQLYGCAIRSADLFEQCISSKINLASVTSIRGFQANTKNITKEIMRLMNLTEGKLIIYYAGHGDHIGSREHWQTASGNIDQIQMASLLDMSKGIDVILISESCSSEHMINSGFIHKNYVYYGATQDYEDAIMTCDGGVFTDVVIDAINNLGEDFTCRELWNYINSSGITMEHFSLRYSREQQLQKNFI